MNNPPVHIGKYNTLIVTKVVDFGLYLDGGSEESGWSDILLPARYAPADCNVGDEVRVFIYFDSEDRIIATTETPKATVGQFAYLRVIDVNTNGAFLQWGLSKDLLVPYSQQTNKMRQGAYYLVYIYQDDQSERIVASSKLNHFVNKTPPKYQPNEHVHCIIMAQTDLGYKAIINHQHTGMFYHNEIFTTLKTGQAITANINKVRDDGKIDLLLEAPNKQDLSTLEQAILDKLMVNNGTLPIGDKTSPKVIYQLFGVSKKNFKRAVSRLYKQRLISVESEHTLTLR
ncbi:MAG: CvfB family protein [Ostreibacterium sp.]